jgi:hypothetical protein
MKSTNPKPNHLVSWEPGRAGHKLELDGARGHVAMCARTNMPTEPTAGTHQLPCMGHNATQVGFSLRESGHKQIYGSMAHI